MYRIPKAVPALCLTLGASAALSLTSSAFAEPGLWSEEAPASRVANAKAAKECDFPPVVYVGGCTGTLVHPRVVVYAWHCGKVRQVKFTESARGKGFSAPIEKCVTYSGGTTNARDWAYCLLKEEVKGVPIVPIVAGCEYEMISKAGQEVVQVGFGKTHNSGAGKKHWGVSRVTSVKGDVVTVGDENSVVACPGDSGGPLMVRMEDKSWRTIGILSTYNGRCGAGGVNWYADAHTAIKWIEKDSGVDITPCFDSDGKWEPGPDCGGFYAGEGGSPKGNWSNKCEGTEVSGRSTTCGEQEGAKDEEPPKVSIESPDSGDNFNSGHTVTVKVKASDDQGVESVELFVDGDSISTLKKEPYEWELDKLEDGEHELKVVAKDKAGNEGKSKVVEISIGDEDDDDDENGSDGDGDDSSDEDGKGKSKKGDKSKKGKDGDDESEDDDDEKDNDKEDDDEGDDTGDGPKAKAPTKGVQKPGGCRMSSSPASAPKALGALALLGLLGWRRRRGSAQ